MDGSGRNCVLPATLALQQIAAALATNLAHQIPLGPDRQRWDTRIAPPPGSPPYPRWHCAHDLDSISGTMLPCHSIPVGFVVELKISNTSCHIILDRTQCRLVQSAGLG